MNLLDVMVSEKWEESTKLHPSVTKLFIRVAVKTTNVRTNHGLQHLVSIKRLISPYLTHNTEQVEL